MTTTENKAVVASFVEEVINEGRLACADDLVAVDFVELDPLPGQQQGREGLKQVIGAFRIAFPDIHWIIEEMVAEGDRYLAALRGMELIAANSSASLPRAGRYP